MNIIKTIDLWTEHCDNHYECFNGAFVDGFSKEEPAFDRYKIIKNCNCVIDVSSKELKINNKHNAIVFYKNNVPIRLMVMNKNTDIIKCIDNALTQEFEGSKLKDYFLKFNIKQEIIDMKEIPIYKEKVYNDEIDVGSCDRFSLLRNMLKGIYTLEDTKYGNFSDDKYLFYDNVFITYNLETDKEQFIIKHSCAFINEIESRIIPIQDNSLITSN